MAWDFKQSEIIDIFEETDYTITKRGLGTGDNLHDGVYLMWWDEKFDYKLRERSEMKNGQMHGKSELWFNNGNIHSVIYYENDQEEGISKTYHFNGPIFIQSEMKSGKLNGITKKWTDQGKLIQHTLYKDGKAVKEFI